MGAPEKMIKNTRHPLLFNRGKWYRFLDLQQNDLGEINAGVWIKSDSFWFSGHFPDNPILPGIAQLSMVLDAVCQAEDERFQLKQVNRVRFKRLIRPDDSVKVVIRPDNRAQLTYTFRVESNGELACSGRLAVTRQPTENV